MISISKARSISRTWRGVRAALAVTVLGGLLLAAPLSPAWAKQKKNSNAGVIPGEQGESYVTGYAILIGGVLLGMTAICRKSHRASDVARSNLEKQ